MSDLKLQKYYAKEERERILGIIELYVTWLPKEAYGNYARRKILELRDIIEKDITM